MPFRRRFFPPGWQPLDLIYYSDYPKETLEGLRKICEMLGLKTEDQSGIRKSPQGLMNTLMKHYGLPYRDTEASMTYENINLNAYWDLLREAEKSSFTLLKVSASRNVIDPSCMTRLFRIGS